MKKFTQTLVIAVLFLGLGIAKASEKRVFDDVERKNYPPVRYNNADPIVFMERGVEFYVFLNGEFDFNTVQTTAPRPRNGYTNTTYGAPRSNQNTYYGPRNNGVKIEHDHMGRVRRVGNVFINYDAYGRVKRIGSIYMSYNRNFLTQVGGLRIVYDRRGRIIAMHGVVNYSNNGQYNNNHYQADGYGGNDDFGNDDFDNDEDFYYYKSDGTKAKVEKEVKKEE